MHARYIEGGQRIVQRQRREARDQLELAAALPADSEPRTDLSVTLCRLAAQAITADIDSAVAFRCRSIQPLVYGRAVRVNPIVTIVALAGAALLGILDVLRAIPVATAVQTGCAIGRPAATTNLRIPRNP
jgi:hypothetical protein